jgi:RHH-type rel operon transcriptional repressor/antitoxin RelB
MFWSIAVPISGKDLHNGKIGKGPKTAIRERPQGQFPKKLRLFCPGERKGGLAIVGNYCYTNIADSKLWGIKMLAIRLPEEIEKRLEALAKATGRSKTFYVREAILEHLDDLEDLYLAEQRLIDIRAGKSKTIPLEEIISRYGLED